MNQDLFFVSPVLLLRPIPIDLDFVAAQRMFAPVIKCVTGSIDLTTSVVNCVIGDITA